MKKGFTLIELLAVIIILAIVSLIATPMVLNLIDESKGDSTKISVELYLDAVDAAVYGELMDNDFNSNKCEIMSTGNLKCDGKIIKVDTNNDAPTGGIISFIDAKIKSYRNINIDGKYVSYIVDETHITEAPISLSTCLPTDEKTVTTGNIPEGENEAGDEYICEVKPGTFYHFFILSNEEDGTTNLILDRNINIDGTLVTKEIKKSKAENGVYNKVSWYEVSSGYGENRFGPVTAMDFLYKATKDWISIPNIYMDYADEGNIDSNYGYGKIITTNNITKITKKNGTVVSVLDNQEGYMNLKARMPYKSEVNNYDSTNKTNDYLYNYLELNSNIQINNISDIRGYWLLCSNENLEAGSAAGELMACNIRYDGTVNYDLTNNPDSSIYSIGVRPVINLEL